MVAAMTETVLGKLEEHEVLALNNLYRTEQELTFRIGQLHRDLLALSMQAGEVNTRSTEIMGGFRKRFGVPEGLTLRLNADGTVTSVVVPSAE